MMYCSKCGAQNIENATFCSQCGSSLNGVNNQPPQQPNYPYQAPQQPIFTAPPQINATPYMVWSIITLILCCWPLGIPAIVFVNKAKSSMNEAEAKKHLKTAMIFNIIGNVGGLIAICAYILIVVLGAMNS